MKTTRRNVFSSWALIVAVMLGSWASKVSAAIYTNANVAADLTNATRWVGGVVPGATDVALWDSTLSTPANCTNAFGGGGISWNGIKIVNPAAAVYITNNSTWFRLYGSGSGPGIDMSHATVDLTITGSSIFVESSSSCTVDVASARTLSLYGGLGIRNSTVTVPGGGTVVYSGELHVGVSVAGLATLNINSGTLTNADINAYSRVGYGATYTGLVNQAGGLFCPRNLNIGHPVGTYDLSGGALNVAGHLQAGISGPTVINVTGGTIKSGGNFNLGMGTGGNTRYTQSGSSVATGGNFMVASGANTSDFILSNGTFYATAWGNLASGSTSTGRLWLAGGTAILPAFPTARGANAYADITMDGGTLQANGASTSYMQGLNHAYLTANGAVFNTAGNSITVSQVLENAASQTGTLTKTGLGTLTLSGANTYSGGTTINGGALQFNSGAVPATGLVTINAGGALNATGAYANVTAWLGSGKITTNSSGALALTGNSSEAVDLSTGSYSNLMLGASAAATYSGTLTPYNKIYRLGGGGAALTISGVLADSGGACSVVAGVSGSAGSVVLSSANTYSGGTVVNGGVLGIGNTNSLGSGLLTMQSGTILSNTVTMNSAPGVTNTINLAGAATIDTTFNRFAISGNITNTGSLTLTGGNYLTLTGTNSFSGGITVNSGQIILPANASSNSFGTGDVNFTADGTGTRIWNSLTYYNNFSINSSQSAQGKDALFGDNSQSPTFTGTITLSNALSSVGGAGTITLNGKVTGPGGLAKGTGNVGASVGTLVLLNPGNDYFGNTTIVEGTLKCGTNNVLPYGVGKGNLVLNGGSARAGTVNLNGFNLAINGLSGTTNTYLGMVTNAVTTTNTLTVGANDATSAFAGLIGGKILLAKTGAGTLTLSGTNTYNAGTVISNGFIAIGNDKALGTGPVTLAGGSLIGAGGNWTVSNAVNVVSNATLDTAGNNLTLAGAVTNIGSLTKIGAGTLTLAGTNGYAGLLTVSNGVLRLATTNALAGNSSLVMAGGSCDLNGQTQVVSTVTGTAPFSNGTLQVTGSLIPGGADAVGTLPVAGNLVVSENAVIDWNYGNSTQDLIQVTGALALPTVATVNVSRVTGSTAEFPKPGVVFSFGSCTRAGTLSQWVINGAPRSDIRAVVRDGQVVLVPASGMILEIQ